MAAGILILAAIINHGNAVKAKRQQEHYFEAVKEMEGWP